MDNKKIFSENLQRYMARNGKSRRDVCEALAISYFTLSDWVQGKKYPRIDKIEKLANYFGIKKSDLIEEQSNEYSQGGNNMEYDFSVKACYESVKSSIETFNKNIFEEYGRALIRAEQDSFYNKDNMLKAYKKYIKDNNIKWSDEVERSANEKAYIFNEMKDKYLREDIAYFAEEVEDMRLTDKEMEIVVETFNRIEDSNVSHWDTMSSAFAIAKEEFKALAKSKDLGPALTSLNKKIDRFKDSDEEL